MKSVDYSKGIAPNQSFADLTNSVPSLATEFDNWPGIYCCGLFSSFSGNCLCSPGSWGIGSFSYGSLSWCRSVPERLRWGPYLVFYGRKILTAPLVLSGRKNADLPMYHGIL